VITFTLYYHTTQAGRILIKISQADFKRRKKYKNNNAKNKKEDNHINHARIKINKGIKVKISLLAGNVTGT